MLNTDVTALPAEVKQAVSNGLKGTVTEVSYSVRNYINSARQLITNQKISLEEAGRETVEGEAIIKKCNVYLPAGYDRNDSTTKYNTLYLLHGVGGNRYEWLDSNGKVEGNYILCNIVDNLIVKGEIDPLIIVFPDGRSACDWTDCSFNSEGTNMLGFYYFDYELRYDLIPFIETTFHTYANIENRTIDGISYNRMHRAIAGLSMGGMQSLNLILGGYRCDSSSYIGTKGVWKNGLDITVLAPGMEDLFAYVGAFSNAPTSSDGHILGSSLASSGHSLELLYITCGTSDGVAFQSGYEKSVAGVKETAGDGLGTFYQILIKDGLHDFNVWNNGAYNFLRLSFGKEKEVLASESISLTLSSF